MCSYEKCTLCARACGIDRTGGEIGFCGMKSAPTVARAALHRWEEPIISGSRGSGTIFFSGCSLSCVFCQNKDISHGGFGKEISDTYLADIMLRLQKDGAHNINFVTPTHFVPSVINSVRIAKEKGLLLPIVYNTGSYDAISTIKALDGTVDVYLPDLKYYKNNTAEKYSSAPDYVDVARAAIDEMVSQVGEPQISPDGIIKRGVVVRILLLPGHLAEAKLSVKYLLNKYGDKIYISLMNQYTPMPGMRGNLSRRVSHEEYEELCDYALRAGLKNGFTQDYGTAEDSFIPPFDLTGV